MCTMRRSAKRQRGDDDGGSKPFTFGGAAELRGSAAAPAVNNPFDVSRFQFGQVFPQQMQAMQSFYGPGFVGTSQAMQPYGYVGPPTVDPAIYNEKKNNFTAASQIDNTRDLYYVKLVAGSLNKQFIKIIEIIDTDSTTFIGASSITKNKYKYGEKLLTAWSKLIETIRTMLSDESPLKKMKSQDLHETLIVNDSIVVAMADYTAFLIRKREAWTIIRGKTRFELVNDSELEDEYLLQIMKSIHENMPGNLDKELVRDYFE